MLITMKHVRSIEDMEAVALDEATAKRLVKEALAYEELFYQLENNAQKQQEIDEAWDIYEYGYAYRQCSCGCCC